MTLSMVFLIAALILFIIAASNVSSRVNLVAAGLACWVLGNLLAQGLLR